MSDPAINPSMFGSRGQAYLQAVDSQSQSAPLQVANTHDDYQNILRGAKPEADNITQSLMAPTDTYTPSTSK